MNAFERPGKVERLPQTHQRILTVISENRCRMTGKQIMCRLEESYGPVGISTVKSALRELVCHGYLTNRQDVRPRGYGLHGWSEEREID